ncbi:MAG: hypothetical protein HGA54_01915 [Actinobacteria bacterium]|nr:hypothetical protein [Actinomycetota bacterium]
MMSAKTLARKRTVLMQATSIFLLCMGLFLLPSTAEATVTLDGIRFKVADSASLDTSDIDEITVYDGGIVYLPSSADVTQLKGTYLFTINAVEIEKVDVETGEVVDAPAGLGLSETSATLQPAEPGEIIVDGSTTSFTIDVSSFATTDADGNTYYDTTFDCEGVKTRVYIYQSANIPSMYIQTGQGLDFIHADKDNVDTGASMAMIDSSGNAVYNNILEEIKGRGNSTWLYEKKPYQIKLGSKTELVPGSGSAKTWILLANYVDETLIRNQLAYNLSTDIGIDYCSMGQHIDLYIDGEYYGNYYLCEKVQVGTTRVDIEELEKTNEAVNPTIDWDSTIPSLGSTLDGRFDRLCAIQYVDFPVTPTDITGGYLLEMNRPALAVAEYTYISTAHKAWINLKSPEQANADEVAYMSSLLQDFEDAIYSPDGYNAKGKHFSEYIDVESFARNYLIQELTANYDGFRSSTFFYKDQDTNSVTGKLYAGPTWDFDVSCANSIPVKDFLEEKGIGYLYIGNAGHTYLREPDVLVYWIEALRTHPEFKQAILDEWDNVMASEVETLLSGGIPDYADTIRSSAVMNKLRWPIIDSPEFVMYGSFDASVVTLTDFLDDRYHALATNDELGAYNLPAGYHSVTIDAALAGVVETTSPYFEEGERATVRVPSGASMDLVARVGAETYPVAETDEPGIYAFIMPAGSVEIASTITTLGSIDSISAQTYTGVEIRPVIVVRDSGGTILSEDVDYSLSFSNATDAGFGFVTAQGIGAHSGTLSRTFSIQMTKSVERLGGSTRYGTCARIVEAAYPSSAQGVIIATGGNYPDALTASALAGLKDYPIIIVPGSELGTEAISKITMLGASEAIIVGGADVVSANCVTQLLEISSISKVRRLEGSDRFGTALAIFEDGRGSWSDTAIITTGYNYADALSISPFAHANDSPIFLTESDGTLGPESVAAILSGGFTDIVLVGGTDVVSAYVETQLGDGYTYTRLGGDDRYDTCVLIADWCTGNDYLTWAVCGVATGMDFPDALTGSILLGLDKGILLLIDDVAESSTFELARNLGPEISTVYLLGGTSVVSPDLATSMELMTAL